MVKVWAAVVTWISIFSLFVHRLGCKMLDFLFAGGIFALYALLCRHARFSLLPNQQAADEEISTYYGPGDASRNLPSSAFKSLIERNKRSKTALLVLVLVGTSMVITIGVLTPAISGNRAAICFASVWSYSMLPFFYLFCGLASDIFLFCSLFVYWWPCSQNKSEAQ